MTIIKALSIRQPWAYAVCVGQKTIENKGRKASHRGPLVIHAGGSEAEVKAHVKEHGKENVPTELFLYGAAIGVVELTDVVELNLELEDNDSAFGPICWKLENARLFKKPVKMKGQLGIFGIVENDAERIQQEIDTATRMKPSPAFLEFVERTRMTKVERKREHARTYFFDLQNDSDAARCCEIVLGAIPDDAEMLAMHAIAAFDNKLSETETDDMSDADFNKLARKALADLNKAIGMKPDDGLFHFWRARILLGMGKANEKKAAIRIGKQLRPDLPWDLFEQDVPSGDDD